MAKKHSIDISKNSKLVKKPFLTFEQVKNRLIDYGYNDEKADNMAEKLYNSQFVFSNLKTDQLIDLNKNLKIIMSEYTREKTPKYEEIPNINEKLKPFIPLVEDISEHIKKKQTPNNLMRNTIQLNLAFSNNPVKINSSVNRMVENYRRLQENSNYIYFDTEIFGGTNKYGMNEMMMFQEIALSYVDKSGIEPKVTKTRSIAFGLDNENIEDSKTIDRIKKYITKYKKTGILDTESTATVTLKRLSKLGHKDTKINYENGIATIGSWVSDELDNDDLNIRNIERGLERVLEIGKYNKLHRTNIDDLGNEQLSLSTLEFFDMLNDLNSNFAVGKNNIIADTRWVNKKAWQLYTSLTDRQKRYLSEIYGEDFGTLYYANGVLDQESVLRTATALKGIGRYATTRQQQIAKEYGLSTGTLNAIGRMYFNDIYEKGGAHTAAIDNLVGINYTSKPLKQFNGKSLLEQQMSDIIESLNSPNGTMKGGKIKIGDKLYTPLFLAKTSDSYSSNPLDMTYDMMDGKLHFGLKATLDKEGNVDRTLFKPGIKKNVTYKVDLTQFTPNLEIIQQMESINDTQYNRNVPFYMLEYTPVYNKEPNNKELLNRRYVITTTKDEAEAHISNNFLFYALEDEEGNRRFITQEDGFTDEEIKSVMEQLNFVSIGKDGIQVSNPTLEDILDYGEESIQNDSAARVVREHKLKKAEDFKRVNRYLEEKDIKNPQNKRDLLAQITSNNIAEEVAKGNDLTLDLQEIKSDIVGLIGYKDNNDKDKISLNTYKNFLSTYDYYDSYGSVLDEMIRLSYKSESPEDHFNIYDRNLEIDINNFIASDKELSEKFAEYKEDLIGKSKRFAYETNYIEIPLKDGYFHNYDNPDAPNILKIDLNPRSYFKLKNQLLNAEYGASSVANMSDTEKEEYAKKELARFANYVNNYFGDKDALWSHKDKTKLQPEDITISVENFSEIIINKLAKLREEYPEIGYETKDDFQNVLKGNLGLSFLKSIGREDVIQKSLYKTEDILANVTFETVKNAKTSTIDRLAKELVNEHLFKNVNPSGKYEELKKIATFAYKQYGFDKGTFYALASKTYSDQLSIAKSITKAIYSNGGNIKYNGDRILATLKDNKQIDITDFLPITEFNDGKFFTRLGGTNLITGLRLNVRDAIDYKTGTLDTDKIKVSSGLTEAVRILRGLNSGIAHAIDRGDNPNDLFEYMLKEADKKIRKNPTISTSSNVADSINSYSNMNIEEIIRLLGYKRDELLKSNILDKNGRKALENNSAENLKKGIANSDVIQMLPANFQSIMKFTLDKGEFDKNKLDDYILSLVNPGTKDTSLAKYIFRLGGKDIVALQRYDNANRPVFDQALNSKVYESKKLNKYIIKNSLEDKSFKYISTFNRLATMEEMAQREKEIKGIGKTTSSINALVANLEDTTYHKLLSNYYEDIKDKISDDDKEKYDKALKFLSNMNLYNGEKIINSRLAYKMFEDAETQYIKATKNNIEVMLNAKIGDEINRKMFEKRIEAIPFVKVDKDGIVKFKYTQGTRVDIGDVITESENYGDIITRETSNMKGLLTMKVYAKDTNIALDDRTVEDELNRYIIKTPKDIYDFINKRYDIKYSIAPAAFKGDNKLYIDQEKGMAVSTAIGAGHIDENIAKVLEAVGEGDLVNKVLNEDYASVLYSDYSDTFKQYGYSTKEAFVNALRKERNFAQDKILGKINGLDKVSIITNDDLAHHNNTAMFIRNMINTAAIKRADELIEDDPKYNTRKALSQAYKEIGTKALGQGTISIPGYSFFYHKDYDRIIVYQDKNVDAVLNRDQLARFGEVIGLDGGTSGMIINDDEGNPLFNINYSNIYMAGDTEFAGVSRSYEKEIGLINKKISEIDGSPVNKEVIKYLKDRKRDLVAKNRLMSIDARSMLSLQSQKYVSPLENNDLRDIWNNLDNGETFNKLFGEIFNEGTDGLTLKEGENIYVNSALLKELEDKVLYNKDLEYLGGKNLKLDKNYISGEASDSIKQRIYKRFADKDISIEKAELNYALEQSKLAMQYNSGKNSYFEDKYIKENGYKRLNILDDIFIPKGHGSGSMVNNEKSLLEDNVLLTIGNEEIAIPYSPSSIVGDQLITSKRDSILRRISRNSRIVEDARQGKINPEKPISFYQDTISDDVLKLKEALKEENNEFEKAVRKVKLSNYNFSKLSGIEYHKNYSGLAYMNNTMYEKSKFAGHTLGELAENDIYISAGTVGESYFENHTNLLNKETLEKYNMTRNEMLDFLEENGTMSLFSRNPNTEARSTTPIMLYLDRTSKSDKIRVTAELIESVNGDFDGDVGALAIAMLTQQSYADAKLQSMKDGTPLAKEWRDMERSIAHSALGNLRARKEIVEPRIEKESKTMLTTVFDIFGKNADGTQRKYIAGAFGKNISSEEILKRTAISKVITDAAINEMGEEKFRALNDDQAYEALIDVGERVLNLKGEYNARSTINFMRSLAVENVTGIAKTAKNDIGYMDTPMFQLQQLAQAYYEKEPNANHIFQAVTKAIRESPISRKKTNQEEATLTSEFREAWQGITGKHSKKDINKFVGLMEPFKDDIISELKGKTTLSPSLYKNDEELYGLAVDKVKELFGELSKNKDLQAVFSDIKTTNYSNINSKQIKATSLPFAEKLADLIGEVKITPEALQSNSISLEGFKKESSRKILEESKDIIKNTQHGMSGLAIGALGLAAAVMLTGYIGGNPSRPAQNHAEQTGNEDTRGYDSLQDEDLQINSLPEGTSKGYVININATSDKGRKHVQDAIQMAMHSSVPTDINIQMNIDDKTSNIDNRYISKLLSGAI